MRPLAFVLFLVSSFALVHALAPLASAAPPQDAVPSAVGTTTTPVTIPPPPSVNDPMLAPVAPARLSIATWREAL